MDEPKKSQAVLDAIRQVQETASQNGHSLGEWKWDNNGCWRAWCDNRNCESSAWVLADDGTGGGSVGGECWIKRYNRIMAEETG